MSGLGDPLGHDPLTAPDLRLTSLHERNHATIAVDRFISQFREKPILAGILYALTGQLQRVEDAAWETILYRRVDNSFGITLDRIGTIVGIGRNNLTDENFRIAIRAQVRLLRSGGRAKDILRFAELVIPDGVSFNLSEEFPASFLIDVVDQMDGDLIQVLWRGLERARALGIGAGLAYSVQAPSYQFVLGGVHEVFHLGSIYAGFGNAYSDSGGHLKSVRVTT